MSPDAQPGQLKPAVPSTISLRPQATVNRSARLLCLCLALILTPFPSDLLAQTQSASSPLLKRLLEKDGSAQDNNSLRIRDEQVRPATFIPPTTRPADSSINLPQTSDSQPTTPLPPISHKTEPTTPQELPLPSDLPTDSNDPATTPAAADDASILESIDPLLDEDSPLGPPAPPPRRAHDGIPINPLGVQQGMANLAFAGDVATPREALGFPATLVPAHWGRRIPRLSLEFSLPQHRSVGKGEPLVGSSWLNRPMHLDLLSGGVFLGELTSGGDRATNGLLTGTRLGWDLNHYVGGELRLAQANTGMVDRVGQVDMRWYDVSVAYYPWGDSRLRPFTSLGLGVQQVNFVDTDGLSIDETLLSMPFGLGVKYMARRNLALRFELIDNLAFGSSVLRTQNALSLTGGLEWRWGGRRRTYFPYDTGAWLW